jgi:hypothetical protein
MKTIIRFSLAALMLMALAGCNAPLNKVDTTPTYYVQAMVINDMANNHTRLDLALTKDGIDYKNAAVTFNGIAIDTNAYGYSRQFDTGAIKTDTFYTLHITDSSTLNVNLTITMPETLSIASAGTRHFTGSAVPVSWSASHRATGYILGTEPPYPTSIDSGYTAYISTTAASVPPDAFMTNQSWTTGLHNLYVVAYAGAPTVATYLPVNLPTTLTPEDNISQTNISGRLCGAVIALPDVITVATQP